MTSFMDMIKERRSIRNYEQKEIPKDVLNAILEAVQWTPSWANTQCWEILVITDQDLKQRLQETVPKVNPAHKSITAAPVLLALCAKKGVSGYYKDISTTRLGDWFMFDLGLAAQSISLAAHAHGLGSLIIGLFDHQQAERLLHVPEGIELVAIMTLGYASKTPSPPKRREIREFVRENKF
jgi:nitroreductase